MIVTASKESALRKETRRTKKIDVYDNLNYITSMDDQGGDVRSGHILEITDL